MGEALAVVQHNGTQFNPAEPPEPGRLCLVDTTRSAKRWLVAYYKQGEWVTSSMTGDVVLSTAKSSHYWAYLV